jgi:hypothetical protein
VQGAHAAGDVEAHAARGDDAAALGVEGRHTADGEAVAPVGVGHGIGGLHDAGQGGHVGDLLVDLLVHIAHQGLAGIDDGRHVHVALGLDAPGEVVYALELLQVHGGLRD